MHDIILGYGDPSAAHYSNLNASPESPVSIDFFDTFLDQDHIKDSFPEWTIDKVDSDRTSPPYKLTFLNEPKRIQVQPYRVPNRGPYPSVEPKYNQIRYTVEQVEAIRSGTQPGLTCVVGPPGTGKTDVAVQIINLLYHNHPNQRTLIVTHSNQALNQIFEKIMALDIDERHLLRLGHGEESLDTDKDFSRYGRVDYVLAKRIELLGEVARLAESLDVASDVASTCETSGYFYLNTVLAKWEAFSAELAKASQDETEKAVVFDKFPFAKFFENAPQPLFKVSFGKAFLDFFKFLFVLQENSFKENVEIATGCWRYLKNVFSQLEEFRAFEMLRLGADRARYLLVREAKIIAMTCTHAALKRSELVQLAFQYDNILMEEAGQILEIETFIPLLLQNPEFGHNRLKRWIIIGDHQQLPPVIKNVSFQKFANMDQSLFTRFVRLGVPTVTLNWQGRARPSICSLYGWRYGEEGLKSMPHVQELAHFVKPNPGEFEVSRKL